MLWVLLFLLQLAAVGAGLALLWRRIERQNGEIAALRRAIEEMQYGAAQQRLRQLRNSAAVVAFGRGRAAANAPAQARPPLAARLRAANAWSHAAQQEASSQTMSQSTLYALLALIAAAPLAALMLPQGALWSVVGGFTSAALLMVLAMRRALSAAAWASVGAGAAWAAFGLGFSIASVNPAAFSAAAALAGGSGLAYAAQRKLAPGAALGAVATLATLIAGAQTGIIGPAGFALAALIAFAAILGGRALRLEALHLGAFAAALAGLFVLSGQASAAIWFTPAAAWAGAVFFGVAAVQTPRLGSRGVAVAALGALAPFMAIAAIHTAHQVDARTAGGLFAALAALLTGVIALAAHERPGGVAALKLTLWVLTIGAFTAATTGVLLALSPPFAALAFAALAAALAGLNIKTPSAVWRSFACTAAFLASIDALATTAMILREATPWDARLALAAGLVAPAALLGAAARFAGRTGARGTAGFSKLAAIGVSVAAADVLVRMLFSAGAPLLQGVGFAEAGFHISAWLLIALVAMGGGGRRPGSARTAAAALLGLGAIAASATTAWLWLTPYWLAAPSGRAPVAMLNADVLGFVAPALLYWTHWVFWRARGAQASTRLALAAAALTSACAVMLVVAHPREGGHPSALGAVIAAIGFGLAIAINFAPGVAAPRSDFEENLHPHRRGHQRG